MPNFLPPVYDKKTLYWGLFGLLFFVLATKATGGSGFIFILPLVLMGFGKNKTALLLWCMIASSALAMSNPNFVPKDTIFGLTTKVVSILVGGVMSLQIIGRRNSPQLTPLLSLFFYIAYMAIVSSVGWMPIISYLKLILFTITFLAFYSVATAAATREIRPEVLRSIFLSFAIYFILGSVALIPFPGLATLSASYYLRTLGYIPEGSLFMGITSHSQALGPMIAVFAILLFADWLFAVRRWDKLYALLFACTPILIYKTGSRTAMGTYLAGLMFVGFFFMRARGVGARWKSRVLSISFVFGVIGCMALFATPSIRQSVTQFIYKTRGAVIEKHEQSFERLVSSRQGKVDEMKVNIAESPLIGNGFQVSKDFEGVSVTNINQLLTAPIEKGVWIYAVVEEGGAFGMILFCIFLLTSFTLLLKRHAYIGTSVLFVLAVSNLGEFTFFSLSAAGGVYWVLIFAALAMDAQRVRHIQRARILGLQ